MRACIIEDEPRAQKTLQQLVHRVAPDVEIIGIAASVEKGLELIRTTSPDFIFLDVQLGDETGFDLLTQLNDPQIDVLFVTAFNEFAIDAFRWDAVHYITKPISSHDLKRGIDKIRAHQNIAEPSSAAESSLNTEAANQQDYLVLRYESIVERQAFDQIIRLQADGNITHFYCLEENLLSRQRQLKRKTVSRNIGHFKTQLPSYFFRCHQSHFINRWFIQYYNKSEHVLCMKDGTNVPVSRRSREGIEEWLRAQQ